tara:strand:+ start:116 stop:562 length:447 start_codon:yes stop_codon:yes gene_type:complete
MKLTIVAEDKTIVKDSVIVPNVDMSSWLPADVWAVEWDSSISKGHVEKNDGSIEELSELGIYQQAVTDFDAALPSSPDVVANNNITNALGQMRFERDLKLSNSDWTQLTDSPLTDAKKTEWATYRQKLRDLPATESDYDNPTWPTEPV